ncbi:uncharacterized protein PAN0_001d0767 [Moesziomyces antarcticus]|uniref:Domain of unknown function at the cortex 1 domain-containing protein n=1 Tax=Pseudozyma antarctica TaxID=84753 RepID=A0A5C3FFF2_PSEA2|nr:uncharacterized protein PAN0_001d0767 [Moesziomyces antarcticus]GAK62567.1 conserved hypothetical protein [Moesziomyces antarcticus]SPO43122.1 uncharacterized protein PSANT_00806 [Moesziomyces antarcticus]
MPRLKVQVGSDRFHMEDCRLNDTLHPHEIETEHFVGRILVRILDAPGAKQGEQGREYFEGRSRKFCIQIEGRFKQRWNGSDILFGTDFDKFVDFPRAPFNAGMKVAKYIDPCTFYELHPESGRPYIMSPYIACMNTFCAWPAPSRAHDAVVVLRHTHRANTPDTSRAATPIIDPEKSNNNPQNALVASPHASGDEDEGDIVPRESLDRSRSQSEKSAAAAAAKKKKGWFGGFGGGSGHAKEERILKKYWRFVGFKDDPRVRALLEAHHAKLRSSHSDTDAALHSTHTVVRQGSVASVGSNDVQHGPGGQTLSVLGMGKRAEMDRTPDRALTPNHGYGAEDMPFSPRVGSGSFADIGAGDIAAAPPGDVKDDDAAEGTANGPTLVAPKPKHGVAVPLDEADGPAPTPSAAAPSNSGAAASTSAEKPEMPKLERIATAVRHEMEESAKSDGLKDGDFKLADTLAHTHLSRSSSAQGRPDAPPSKLDEQLGPWRFADPGTDMIEDNAFIFTTQSLPVPRRRKHFANEKNRLDFHYDPDVVYGASFFTDAMDFNTFNLGIGPVKINVAKWFHDMPVRYTLRSTTDENLTFATISFQLVDE